MIKKYIFSVLCLFLWFTSFSYDVKSAYSTPPLYSNYIYISGTFSDSSRNFTNFGFSFPNYVRVGSGEVNFYKIDSFTLRIPFFSNLNNGYGIYYSVRAKITDNYNNIITPNSIDVYYGINNASYISGPSNVPFIVDDEGYININRSTGSPNSSSYKLVSTEFRMDFDYDITQVDNYQILVYVDYAITVGGTVADFYSYLNNYFLFNGTSASNSSSDSLDTANENLGNAFNDYDDIEKGQVEDFNTNIGNLNTDLGILNLSDFTTTAMWLSNQMTRIVTSNNVIQYMITFSLIIGFALVLIGRGLR